MREIPSLTGLRGAAAFWVVLFHVGSVATALGAGWIAQVPALNRGWMAVDLFFVLSGFILMRVYAAQFTHPTFAGTVQFFRGRLLRVYPLSIAVLLLIALLAWCDPGFIAWCSRAKPGDFSAAALVRTALLATRWGLGGGEWNPPVWSLSVEMIGYAAFPLLAWVLSARSFWAAIAVAFASFVGLAFYQNASGHVGMNLVYQEAVVARMSLCFTAGVSLCRAQTLAHSRISAHASTLSLLASIGVVISLIGAFGPLIAPASFGLLIFSLSFGVGPIDRLMSSETMMTLGRLSFPLYLVHDVPLIWLSYRFEGGLGAVTGTAILGACVAACVGLAWLLHRLVEQPVHRWAHGERRRSPRQTPIAQRAI
jgi:peptidoglycan/LPS O-acetylase OafA/YrhL